MIGRPHGKIDAWTCGSVVDARGSVTTDLANHEWSGTPPKMLSWPERIHEHHSRPDLPGCLTDNGTTKGRKRNWNERAQTPDRYKTNSVSRFDKSLTGRRGENSRKGKSLWTRGSLVWNREHAESNALFAALQNLGLSRRGNGGFHIWGELIRVRGVLSAQQFQASQCEGW